MEVGAGRSVGEKEGQQKDLYYDLIFRYGCIALQSSWNIALSGPILPPYFVKFMVQALWKIVLSNFQTHKGSHSCL